VTNINERCNIPCSGHLRVLVIDEKTGNIDRVVEKQNLILYSAADILAQLIAGQSTYSIQAMYVEFKNLAAPSDPVSAPAYDRTGDISYYNGLSGSVDTDYLRVPLTVSASIGTSDATKYNGNQVTFYGVTAGTSGIHGKTFAETSNSAVYGYGLVATPVVSTQATDRVFSRAYSTKLLKTSGKQIGVQWTIRFG